MAERGGGGGVVREERWRRGVARFGRERVRARARKKRDLGFGRENVED